MKKIRIEDVEELAYYDVCENGLEIFILPNYNVEKFYITLNIRYGSVCTEFKHKKDKTYTKVPNGIAHFLEHQMFYEPDGTSAHEKFNKLGSYINAGTSFDYTAYEVRGTNKLEENINYLLDYVNTPYFISKNVNKEKGIIVEEIKMYEDRPYVKGYYTLMNNIFSKSNYRYLISGVEKEVRRTTSKQIQKVYDYFYHPQNMYIVITGNIDPVKTVAIIKQNQDSKEFSDYNKPIIKKIHEPESVKKKYEELELNVEYPKVSIGIKIPKSKFKKEEIKNDRYIIMLNALLNENFGSYSFLNEELKESELITSSVVAGINIYGDYIVLSLVTETKYPDEVINKLKEKLYNLEYTNEDLDRLKRSKKASRIKLFENIMGVNENIADSVLYTKKIDTTYIKTLNSIKLSDINNIKRVIDLKNSSILIINPIKKKTKKKKEAKK